MTGHGAQRTVRLTGNVLVLTEDPAAVAAQLDGTCERAPAQLLTEPLRGNISTDEIIPCWCCYWYDKKLGDYAYLGLKHPGVRRGGGEEVRPADHCQRRCQGLRILRSSEDTPSMPRSTRVSKLSSPAPSSASTSRTAATWASSGDDFPLLDALLAGEELPLEAVTRRATGIERAPIDLGGLFGFNRHTGQGKDRADVDTAFDDTRPLDIVEKIVQSHLAPRNPLPDVASVRVGESYFLAADVRFSHEYVAPMAAGMFRREFGVEAGLDSPDSCYFFQDHLSLAAQVDRYVNRRPLHLDHGTVDLYRENTQGLYSQVGGAVGGQGRTSVAMDECVYTCDTVERFVRHCLRDLREAGRRKVTLVHKANVVPHTGRLWQEVFRAELAQAPELTGAKEYIDAFCCHLVRDVSAYEGVLARPVRSATSSATSVPP
ncbi:isocitrate/isopropylmalate family dehydrogenase [Streptomyces sp. NPDC019531]|uniref:isocitrate/isopropylmalate family dehydrogenase n=1 Tax=Streptomyces sp. NPDC019531 TaxID=3365062 RepID=UPI00384D55C0